MSPLRIVGILGLLLITSSCATPEIYQTKPAVDVAHAGAVKLGKGGYRITDMPNKSTSPDLMMILAFSGGGKRSAAFSYGVLRGLRDMPVHTARGENRLLDYVNGIGSVSGGTFTAAYYALHRDKIFSDYESDFLKQDIDSYVWGLYLLPWHWSWMFHPLYGTNDAMQNIYDDLMFHGATYADLKKLGPPVLWIGATDISYGRVFTFNQDAFDLICSDLASFPLARAVAASNGLPILFSPITLENHANDCGGYRPGWIDRPFHGPEDTAARRKLLAQTADAYLDVARTPYIHLADGGVSDNLALRGLINLLVRSADDPQFISDQNLASVRRVVVVSVDGESAQNTSLARDRVVTGLGQIIGAFTGTQIDNYNFETMTLMREAVERTAAGIKELRCKTARSIDGYPCDDVEGYLVNLSLSEIKDSAVRTRLENIPTGLTIPDPDVDALVAACEEKIKSSPEISKIIQSLEQRPATTVSMRKGGEP